MKPAQLSKENITNSKKIIHNAEQTLTKIYKMTKSVHEKDRIQHHWLLKFHF